MFTYKKFDVEIAQDVDIEQLDWPRSEEVADESNPGCNRSYIDLRRMPWSEAKRVYQCESNIMIRLETASDYEEELDLIEEELFDDPDGGIYGLDIGIASTVIAISAARCIPVTSCNAGAFDKRHHNEIYPLVACYARAEWVPNLIECAKEAGAGVYTSHHGLLAVYADDIRDMRRFAHTLVEKRTIFNSLRVNKKVPSKNDAEQPLLF